MVTMGKRHPRLEIGVRVAADTVMVNVSLAAAMLLRYIIETWAGGTGASHDVLLQYVAGYLQTSWILTAISLIIFSLSGFYTRGRYYQSGYKVLIVAQAVSLSYLVFGCIAWLTQAPISILPRSVLFIGWILTCSLLIVSRMCSMLWRMVDGKGASTIRPDIRHEENR